MAFFRIEKTQNYTVMSNYHLKDMGLSLKAKGLLSIMLSLPDEWEFSLNGLVAICKESETAIKNTLKELKEAGYVEIVKERTDKGTYIYIYNVYEVSKQSQKPQVENLEVDELGVDNNTQLNTKELNTKELNTKNKKKESKEKSYDEILEENVSDSELKEAFKEFIKMRKMMKKPLTNRALLLLINKLNKMSSNTKEQVEIVNQSIMRGWQGFFPLKEEQKKQEPEMTEQQQELLDMWSNL